MALFQKINVGRVATSVKIMGQDDGRRKIHGRHTGNNGARTVEPVEWCQRWLHEQSGDNN